MLSAVGSELTMKMDSSLIEVSKCISAPTRKLVNFSIIHRYTYTASNLAHCSGDKAILAGIPHELLEFAGWVIVISQGLE